MGGERVVILSDTHGRLPEEVVRACRGAARIVHAGDVGAEEILPALEAVAPLTAVSGNVDPPDRAPGRARFEVSGWRVLVQHIVWDRGGPSSEVRDLLARRGADLVVFGHSHEPLCERREETIFFNPGSCGPKRFSFPRSYAEAILRPGEAHLRILSLDAPPGAPPLLEARFARPGGVEEG